MSTGASDELFRAEPPNGVEGAGAPLAPRPVVAPAVQDFGPLDFQPVFVPKAANAVGLHLAELTARPVALSYLRPNQPNPAFAVAQTKTGGLANCRERPRQ